MAEQKPRLWDHDLFWAALLLCVVVLFCGRILFTDQIIRASDVITQFFWAAKQVKQQTPFEYLGAPWRGAGMPLRSCFIVI